MHVFQVPAAHCNVLRRNHALTLRGGNYRYEREELVELQGDDGQVVLGRIVLVTVDNSLVVQLIGEGTRV